MTYQIRLQTGPRNVGKPTSTSSSDTRTPLKVQMPAQRKRSATSVNRRESQKNIGSSVRTKITELRGRYGDQREGMGLNYTGSGPRKTSFKQAPSSGNFAHRSGDHWTRLHGLVATQPQQVAPPAVGDTVEMNYTMLSERDYSTDHAAPSARNLNTRSAPVASRQSIRLKDRREISRIEHDRLQAARVACLLAKEAAVVSARQKVLERREAKLADLRERMQLRHQQAETRRKALEQATKDRLLRLSQRQHRATISHPPSGNYSGPSLRTAVQFRSLRLINRPNTTHSDRRPLVAFGSSTPRMICFTSRELQALYNMNSNSSCPVDTEIPHQGQSDNISASNASIKDSVRSNNRFVRSPSPRMSKHQPTTDPPSSISRKTDQLSARSLSERRRKLNGNAMECTMSKSCTERINAYAVQKSKQSLEKIARISSGSMKRTNTARTNEVTMPTHLSGNSSFKIAPHRVSKTLPAKPHDIDAGRRRSTSTSKSINRKSDHVKLSGDNSLRLMTNSTMASIGTKSNPVEISQLVCPLEPAVKDVDHHAYSLRRRRHRHNSQTKPRTNKTSDDEEAYRVKMQQQRKKAREKMELSKSTKLDHANTLEGNFLTKSGEDSAIKPVTNEMMEGISDCVISMDQKDEVQQDGDFDSNEANLEPILSVPDTLPNVQASTPSVGLDSSRSDSTLWIGGISAPVDQDDTEPVTLTANLRTSPLSHSLNFDTHSDGALLKGKETAERKARKQRLEGIMARLRPPNQSDSSLNEISDSTPFASGLPHDSHEVRTLVQNGPSPTVVNTTSPVAMGDQMDRLSVPQSATELHFNDPEFPNGSVVSSIVDALEETPNRPSDLIVERIPGSEATVLDQTVSTPTIIPASSAVPKRASVVANLLASGRLNVRSRAATILLNMASGRSATEGLGTQSFSNATGSLEMLNTHPTFRRKLTPDVLARAVHEDKKQSLGF